MKSVHICRFETTSDVRKPTYEKLKNRILEAGRYSVFDATRSQYIARIFDQLQRDPELVITPVGFPWIKVERNTNAPTGRVRGVGVQQQD